MEESLLFLANVPLDFAPYATFAVYAIISVVRNDQSLLASKAFTSLSLISLLTQPLLTLVQVVPNFFESMGCFERVELYLERQSVGYNCRSSMSDRNTSAAGATQHGDIELMSTTRTEPDASMISFKEVNISWSGDSRNVFENCNLDIGKGITMIIGAVGSGKSTLIESVLGETVIRSGMISTPLTNFAYCPQAPWILNDTIQRNITGGNEFDEKWYDFCVSACALDHDLRALPAGSKHVAGSGGTSLSGGQKQRIVSRDDQRRCMFGKVNSYTCD